MSELTVIEIKPEQAPALYVPNGLDVYLEKIRELAKEVPDVTTQKGRDRIGSLARSVGSSKKAIEEPGRAYLKHLKELPKEVEAELRRFVTECDTIRDAILKPRVEWEQAEESRKNALQQRLNELRALGDVMSADGNYLPSVDIQARISEAKSVALDDSWEEVAAEAGVAKDATIQKLEAAFIVAKQREDQAAELERLRVEAEEKARVEREEKLKREAAEAARLEAEQKARAEREAAARRELELKMKAEQEERARIEAEQRAEREKKEAAERAEREKQAAIAEEKRKAQEEADRIRREAEAREAARIAEQQRIAAEEAARAADVEHRRTINRRVISQLVEQGVPEEFAKAALVAIASGKIQDAIIRY